MAAAAHRTVRRLILVVALCAASLPLTAPSASAQTTEGTLFSFGATADGRLGHPGTGPAPVDLGSAVGDRVVDVDGGDAHSVALTANGDVFTWGDTTSGQGGRGTFGLLAQDLAPGRVTIPSATNEDGSPTTVTDVAAGAKHTLALRSDGTVFAWGSNASGQIGRPQNVLLSPTPVKVSIPEPVAAVAAGANHSLAITRTGKLYVWGLNTQGQAGPTGFLGSSQNQGAILIFRPTLVRLAFTVVEVAAGDAHTVVLAADGTVWGFGRNDAGQLGDRPVATDFMPQRIDVGGTAVELDATAAGTIIRRSDGSVAVLGAGRGSDTQAWRDVPGLVATELAGGGTTALAEVPTADGTESQLWSFDLTPDGDLTPTRVVGADGGEVLDTIVTVGSGTDHRFAVEAPRISVDTDLADFATTFGAIQVFDESRTLPVTVTNDGPGAATVTPEAPGSNQFTVSDDCGVLAAGDSCTIDVTFSPRLTGVQNGTLTIDHDGFGDALTVGLTGIGYQLAGAISVHTDDANLFDGVPASPSQIDIDDIPVQPGAPRTSDQEAITKLPLVDVLSTTKLPLVDVLSTTKLPLVDVLSTTKLPLVDVLSTSPAAVEVLESVSLASLPLYAPYRWDDPGFDDSEPVYYDDAGYAVLSGSPDLHGRSLQTLSLADVLRDPVASDRWAHLPVAAIDFHQSKLATVSAAAFLIGDVTFGELGDGTYGFCATLAAAGDDTCGAAYAREGGTDILSTTPFEAELAGLPLDTFELGAVRLADIPADRSIVRGLSLTEIPLYASNLGGVALDDVADRDAVTTCAACETVYDARDDLYLGAQVGDLSPAVDTYPISSILYGLQPAATLPFGSVSLYDLLVRYYADPAVSSTVDFWVDLDVEDYVPDGSSIRAMLPPSYGYIPHSAFATVDGGTPVELTASGDPTTPGLIRWDLDPITPLDEGATVRIDFSVHPGLTLGVFTIDEVALVGPTGGAPVVSTGAEAPVHVRDHEVFDGRDDTVTTAEPIAVSTIGGPDTTSGTMELGFIETRNDVDLYRFPVSDVPPDSQIRVDVQHQLSGDVDVLLYGPSDQLDREALRTPEDREPLTYGEDLLTSADGSTTSLASDAILRERSVIGDGYDVLALSQERDANDEFATAIAPAGGTGDYIVAVVPYNGSFGPDAYSLRVTIVPPADLDPVPARPAVADPVAPATGDPVLVGDPSTASTLILTAPSRLADEPGADLLATLDDPRLQSIAGSTAAIAVDRVPDVASAMSTMDADPGDVHATNDVVAAINAYVDGLAGPNLRYLVIAGGDDAIPMARLADLSVVSSERYYTGEARGLAEGGAPNALAAAAAQNRFLSDAPYADLAPTPVIGKQYLYVEDLSIGRLVESESDIVALLDQFVAYGGELDPTTAVSSSSADFLDDGARAVAEALDGVLGAGATQVLVSDEDWANGGTSGNEAISTAIDTHDVLAISGHATPFAVEVGGADVEDFTPDALTSTTPTRNALLLSAGCHVGLPVSDSFVRSGLPAEFSQAAGRAGIASTVGNTGYGTGSKSIVAYTERLLVEYASRLGGDDQGTALRAAKRAYLESEGYLDAIDLKVVQEATHYGMPHLAFRGAVPPAEPTPLSAVTSGTVDVDVQVVPRRIDTADGSYYSTTAGVGGIISAPDQPVVPATTQVVSSTGSQIVGFLFDSASSFEAPGQTAGDFFDPVLETVELTDHGSLHSPAEWNPTDVNFPANLWAAQGNQLRLATGLFRSLGLDDRGETVGAMTVFTDIRGRAFVEPVGAPQVAAPQILSARTVADDGTATFTMEVRDALDIPEASVFFRERSDSGVTGQWRSLLLEAVPGSPGTFTAGTAITNDTVEAIFQARNAANRVTQLTNKARLVPAAALLPGPFLGVDIDVAGVPAPSNPDGLVDGYWESADVTLNNTSDQVLYITATVNDGEPFVPQGNDPELTDLPEGDNRIVVYVGGRRAGEFIVKVDRTDPTVLIRNPSGGVVLIGEIAAVDFECTDRTAGVTSCTATLTDPNGVTTPIADGDPLPTDQFGTYSLTVTAVDGAGHVTTRTEVYVTEYDFVGFFEPVTNLDQDDPVLNDAEAGRTVPFKWRLFDGAGNEITSTDVVDGWDSFEIACSDSTPVEGTATTSDDPQNLYHDGTQYHLDWKTDRRWPTTSPCRVFVLRLDSGQTPTAAFRFH